MPTQTALRTCPVAVDKPDRRGRLRSALPPPSVLHQVRRCEDFPVGGCPQGLRPSPRAGAGQPEADGEDHPPAVQVKPAHPVSMGFRHNKCQNGQEQAVLLQGVQPPSASAVDPEPQPQPHPLLREAPTYAHLQYVFLSPPNATGLAKQRNRPGAAVRTIAPALAPLVIPVLYAPALPSSSSAAAAGPRPVPRTTSWRHKKRA
ncbi:uncharacterized protein LOC121303604 [Polyodon spathula]|uniref:uncharacterized protein LOC121303604 n=1 Tax=Polyodon spathula TaxID=7913 RepID=UPI001B7E0FFC|nr:uncharacterized protein LOC121303604 [Polyodon spathula]